jgi:bla regulator protein BlaR1
MTALLVKSTVAMFGALLLVTAARRSRASLRHLILAALFAFLLLLPAVQWMAPVLRIPVPATALVGSAQQNETSTEKSAPVKVETNGLVVRRPTDWPAIALRVYLPVAALLLVWLAAGVLRLRRLANDAEMWLEGTARMNEVAHGANVRRSALVVLSREVAVPLTFGFRRSTIVLPYAARHWNAGELTRALRHELEHVRREDWLLQLAARAGCALYWPHPLVWTAWRRFCLEAERACDDAVIRSGEPAEYAGQLVSLAANLRRLTALPALGMASRSKLAQRVEAILDPRQRRGPHGELSAAIVLVLLVAFLAGVAPAQLIAAATDAVESQAVPGDSEVDARGDHPQALGEALVRFAERGDMENLRRLFDSGVDVNTVAPGDGTALIGAARAGQVRTVEFLLNENADPNLASRGDGNPLIAAAAGGYREIVELLLNAGADRDTIVPGDENPLMQAAWEGHADVVRLLLERGADVNARTYEGEELRTPLRLARRGGYEVIAKMLLAAGAKE